MNILAIKNKIASNAANIPGWKTKRRIVVIESDDWGTIRMASKESYQRLLKKGYPVDKNEYNQYDALESNLDLELLFEVLHSVKDKNGNPAIITANNIVANPDFDKIKECQYSQYFYQSFPDTLSEYPDHDRVMDLYREGIEKKLIFPQLHGREHVNVINWMRAMQQGDASSLDAFKEKMFTVAKAERTNCRRDFLDGFGSATESALQSLRGTIKEATELFYKIWNFKPITIIAPCYTWHSKAEEYFFENGIKYIQGGRVQKVPKLDDSGLIYKRHYTGQYNVFKQIFLVRNAFFEPSNDLFKDWIDTCLNEIKNSFFWDKPAIISSHRLNYIGFIDPLNRERNLKLLRVLLSQIVSKWPEVEFMTSDQLGNVIQGHNPS